MSSTERKSAEASLKGSQDDEKHSRDEEVISVVDSIEGDEALKLVGRERTAQFSDEYNRKLRWKLVSHTFEIIVDDYSNYLLQDLVIPPLCAAVYFTQFL